MSIHEYMVDYQFISGYIAASNSFPYCYSFTGETQASFPYNSSAIMEPDRDKVVSEQPFLGNFRPWEMVHDPPPSFLCNFRPWEMVHNSQSVIPTASFSIQSSHLSSITEPSFHLPHPQNPSPYADSFLMPSTFTSIDTPPIYSYSPIDHSGYQNYIVNNWGIPSNHLKPYEIQPSPTLVLPQTPASILLTPQTATLDSIEAVNDHYPQSRFISDGKMKENQYPIVNPHHSDEQHLSLPPSSYQQYPPSVAPPYWASESTSFSSGYVPNGHVSFTARDENLIDDSNAAFHHPESSPTSLSVHKQEGPTNYSSDLGKEEDSDQNEKLYKSPWAFTSQHHAPLPLTPESTHCKVPIKSTNSSCEAKVLDEMSHIGIVNSKVQSTGYTQVEEYLCSNDIMVLPNPDILPFTKSQLQHQNHHWYSSILPPFGFPSTTNQLADFKSFSIAIVDTKTKAIAMSDAGETMGAETQEVEIKFSMEVAIRDEEYIENGMDSICGEGGGEMNTTAANTITRKENEGLSINSSFLLFLVSSQEEASMERAVCKPSKAPGIHTVSLHPGASWEHQIHGLKKCEPEFLVSTPERLLEFFSMESGVSLLVVDGLENYTNDGQLDILKSVGQYISDNPQTLVFSDCSSFASIPIVRNILPRTGYRLTLNDSTTSQSAYINQFMQVCYSEEEKLSKGLQILNQLYPYNEFNLGPIKLLFIVENGNNSQELVTTIKSKVYPILTIGTNGSLRFEIELKRAANAGFVSTNKLLQPIKDLLMLDVTSVSLGLETDGRFLENERTRTMYNNLLGNCETLWDSSYPNGCFLCLDIDVARDENIVIHGNGKNAVPYDLHVMTKPYGIPCMVEIFHFLCSLLHVVEHMGMGPRSNIITFDKDVFFFALGLINSEIELGGPFICRHPILLSLVQHELLQFGLSMSPLIHSMVRNIVLNLYQQLRTELKLQLEAFFSYVIWKLAQSRYRASYQHQEVAMEVLVDFCRQKAFMMEMYANLNCDITCCNVFEDLANLLSKSVFPVKCPLSAMHILAWDGLIAVIQGMAERISKASIGSEPAPVHLEEYTLFWMVKYGNYNDPDQWVPFVQRKKYIKRRLIVGADGAFEYDTTPLVFDPGGLETQFYMFFSNIELTSKLSNMVGSQEVNLEGKVFFLRNGECNVE